ARARGDPPEKEPYSLPEDDAPGPHGHRAQRSPARAPPVDLHCVQQSAAERRHHADGRHVDPGAAQGPRRRGHGRSPHLHKGEMRRAASIAAAGSVLLVLLSQAASSRAVTSQTWRQREKDDFAKGETKGISLL